MRHLLATALALSLAAPVGAQAPAFSVRAQDRLAQGTAALWTDLDASGLADLVFANGQQAHTLYLQTSPGFFELGGIDLGASQLTDGVFADLDGDGDRDFLHGSLSGSVYLENTGGTLVPAALPGFTGLSDVRTVDAVDVDGDGRLDVFAGTRFGRANVLLLQTETGWQSAEGDLVEDEVTTNAACWGDADDDGDLDVYLANSGGTPDRLYRNDGGGSFSARNLTLNPEDASTSCVWGDADGDLDLDLFVTAANGRRSRLFLNSDGALSLAGTDVFPDVRADLFNASWADLDNDGDMDLVAVGRDEPVRAFIWDAGRFQQDELLLPAGFATAAALYDYDHDGDLDMALSVGDSARDEPNLIARNDLPAGTRWIDVALRGTASNGEGVGASVTAYLRGADGLRALRQTMLAHTSRRTQSNTELHFGLGDAVLDSVAVRWPTGARDVYTDLAEGDRAVLMERTGVDAARAPRAAGLSLDVWPNPVRETLRAALWSGADGLASVEVVDVLGRRVRYQTHLLRAGVRAGLEIDLGELAPGVYVVRGRQAGASVSSRVTLTGR